MNWSMEILVHVITADIDTSLMDYNAQFYVPAVKEKTSDLEQFVRFIYGTVIGISLAGR